MPWNSVVRPSIQVGILRSVAEAEGWKTKAYYAYLDFYGLARSELGLSDEVWADAYETVSEKLYHLAAGDWIFAQRHADAAQRDAYFAVLRDHRADANTIELIDSLREVAETHVERTARALLEDAPSVIGFTSMFSQNGPTLAVAERLREHGYRGVIVMGGSNCEGSMGRTLLAHHPAVDAVVDGPGEDAFTLLLQHAAAGTPAPSEGRLRSRNGPAGAPAAEPRPDRPLTVPTPNYDGFFDQLHTAGLADLEPDITLPVEFSRGCWWAPRHTAPSAASTGPP